MLILYKTIIYFLETWMQVRATTTNKTVQTNFGKYRKRLISYDHLQVSDASKNYLNYTAKI